MKILITGCCGFIGYHLTIKLLKQENFQVYGIDNINNYYDINLKKNRLKNLKLFNKFKFFKIDITNEKKILNNFKKYKYDSVINLAAQAGVRYSISNPKAYFDSNIKGFFSIIEACNYIKTKHLLFASTSSVYGNSKNFPLKETDHTSKPLTFYAASKKTNEVMAYSYSNIYKLPITALRFFTVYGPYGRPDMALFKFTKAITEKDYLELYNNGNHYRDFTYIDDVTQSIYKLINKPSKKDIPFEVYNIASSKTIYLKKYLKTIEKFLQKKAKLKKLTLQQGDIKKTHASISKLESKIGKIKITKLEDGIGKFLSWYKNYYKK